MLDCLFLFIQTSLQSKLRCCQYVSNIQHTFHDSDFYELTLYASVSTRSQKNVIFIRDQQQSVLRPTTIGPELSDGFGAQWQQIIMLKLIAVYCWHPLVWITGILPFYHLPLYVLIIQGQYDNVSVITMGETGAWGRFDSILHRVVNHIILSCHYRSTSWKYFPTLVS